MRKVRAPIPDAVGRETALCKHCHCILGGTSETPSVKSRKAAKVSCPKRPPHRQCTRGTLVGWVCSAVPSMGGERGAGAAGKGASVSRGSDLLRYALLLLRRASADDVMIQGSTSAASARPSAARPVATTGYVESKPAAHVMQKHPKKSSGRALRSLEILPPPPPPPPPRVHLLWAAAAAAITTAAGVQPPPGGYRLLHGPAKCTASPPVRQRGHAAKRFRPDAAAAAAAAAAPPS